MRPGLRRKCVLYMPSLLPSGNLLLIVPSPLTGSGAESVWAAGVCVQLPRPHLSVPATQSPSHSPSNTPVLMARNWPSWFRRDLEKVKKVGYFYLARLWEHPRHVAGHPCAHREPGRLPYELPSLLLTSSLPCLLLLDLLCKRPAHSFQSKGRTSGGHCTKFSP